MSQDPFYEALWDGEGIGDGGDVDEALLSYALVQDDDLSWDEAVRRVAQPPCVKRYRSFEAYLDNADELETIPVTAAMIEAALAQAG
ncbi:MAG: hypothetical protein ACKOCM_03975 [Cyanobacteriota bacterium]